MGRGVRPRRQHPRATRAVIATIISPGIDLLFGGDLMLHRRKVSAPADHDRWIKCRTLA